MSFSSHLLTKRRAVLFLVAVASLASLFVFHSKTTFATNPSLISFQGKVVNADGTNVTNGSYNFDFVLYDDPTLGSPSDGVHDKWHELTKSVVVTNGVFQTNLGSATALPDFNALPTLYLAIRFNADAQGYMTPRVQLTSVPYALNSDKLGGLSNGSFVQLAQGVQNDTSTTNPSIFINKNNSSGTPNILEIQKASANVLTLDNGGLLSLQPASSLTAGQNALSQTLTNGAASGTAIGFLQTITVSTSAAATTKGLEIDLTDNTSQSNTNQGLRISLAGTNNNSAQTGISVNNNKGIGVLSISQGYAASQSCADLSSPLSIGVCGNTSVTNVNTGTAAGVYGGFAGSTNTNALASAGGSGVFGVASAAGAASNNYAGVKGRSNQTANAAYNSVGVYGDAKGGTGATVYGGYFALQSGTTASAGAALYSSNNGIALPAAVFQTTSNVANAFQVQNSSSKGILTADTSGGQVLLGNVGTSGVNGSLVFNSATAGNFTTTLVASGSQSASYSLTLPTAAPTGSGQCIQTSGSATQLAFGSCGGGGGTLATSYAAGSSQSDSTMSLDSTRLGIIIQDAGTPISGNLLAVKAATANGGGNYLAITASAVTMQDTAGNDALVFDSTSSTLKIYENISSPANYLSLYYDNATSSGIITVSSGTVKVGPGSGPISIVAGTSSAVTITANAASTWSTTAGALTIQAAAASTWSTVAGNLTIQGGSGTVSLGTSTSLTASSNLTVQGGTTLVLDAAAGSTITIGSGSNYVSFAATTRELTLNGTARHAKTVTLVPEYPGAVMTGDGANNTGTMTSDFCSGSSLRSIPSASNPCGASEEHNFYTWVTTSQNDYDIWVRWQVPSDFSDFAASNPIQMYAWRTDSTASTQVDLTLYNASGSACGNTSVNMATGTAAWTQTALTGTITAAACSISAGNIVDFRIQMVANNKTVRAGEVSISYLGKW